MVNPVGPFERDAARSKWNHVRGRWRVLAKDTLSGEVPRDASSARVRRGGDPEISQIPKMPRAGCAASLNHYCFSDRDQKLESVCWHVRCQISCRRSTLLGGPYYGWGKIWVVANVNGARWRAVIAVAFPWRAVAANGAPGRRRRPWPRWCCSHRALLPASPRPGCRRVR